MAENQQAPIDVDVVDPSPIERKLRSGIWQKFKKVKGNNGEQWAFCNLCKKRFTGASSSGTTHLRRHLAKCPRKISVDVGQQMLSVVANAQDKSVIKNWKFNQERSRLDLARAILKHEYPFNMVEHKYFRIFLKNLQPLFNIVSRNTIKNDIMEIFRIEKENLYRQFDSLASRISLTTDMWTSRQNDGYLCLTAHYVDAEWNLQKKIINFVMVGDSPNAETLYRVVLRCLLDWNIDKKISTITVDNCSTNDSMISKLKVSIGQDENLLLNGDVFHIRCCAHILNLIVQDGLSVIKHVLVKIRESVKYIRASPVRKQRWEATVGQLKLQGNKGVSYDVPTRWNSTYLMLESALEYKDAFSRLEQADNAYKAAPSKEDWVMAKVICDILKNFYDASKLFSGTQYPTANQYFPEVADIHLKLIGWSESDNTIVSTMAEKMKTKFDKYWSVCILVLAIAVVLDPRFKLKIVEYYFNLIYGFDSYSHVMRIRDGLSDIYSYYERTFPSSSSLNVNVGTSSGSSSYDIRSTSEDKLKAFDSWYSNGVSTGQNRKSDLDLYLEEPIFPRVENFDILVWWKANAPKYPTLAKMARDILMIPVSTVASEATFSTSGRVLDQYRSSMLPETVEALICGQDWVQAEEMDVGTCSSGGITKETNPESPVSSHQV